MWIDSHMHLDAFLEDGSWESVWSRAKESRVEQVIAIGGTAEANRSAVRIAEENEGVHAVVGYDRDEAGRDPSMDDLRELFPHPRVVGVGETGLDYHYQPETALNQKALLEQMLSCALEFELPVVIHTRDAEDDTYQALRSHVEKLSGNLTYPGVVHCYTGGPAFARKLLTLGYMLSFSGIVTFKTADQIREALRCVPDDRLLIETDAPYLAPVPHRGKRNEPGWVRHTGEFIADYLGRSVEEIASITSRNARNLFSLQS